MVLMKVVFSPVLSWKNAEVRTAADEEGNDEQRAAELPHTSENGNLDHTPRKRKSTPADHLEFSSNPATHIPCSLKKCPNDLISQMSCV